VSDHQKRPFLLCCLPTENKLLSAATAVLRRHVVSKEDEPCASHPAIPFWCATCLRELSTRTISHKDGVCEGIPDVADLRFHLLAGRGRALRKGDNVGLQIGVLKERPR
jgi:hypothetical protein